MGNNKCPDGAQHRLNGRIGTLNTVDVHCPDRTRSPGIASEVELPVRRLEGERIAVTAGAVRRLTGTQCAADADLQGVEADVLPRRAAGGQCVEGGLDHRRGPGDLDLPIGPGAEL